MRHRHLRRSLSLTTALGALMLAGTARAQNLPQGHNTTDDQIRGSIGVLPILPADKPDYAMSNGNKNLNVTLNAQGTVIDWNSYNVAQGYTVNYRADTSKNVAVLNRVTGTGTSTIDGTVTSDSNVAVWLLNPNGIMVGGTAHFTTGSLVMSTLKITDDNFLDGSVTSGASYALTTPLDSTAKITIDRSASIILKNDGNRGLVLVAPQIAANGTFDAGDGQDVAFVTATDVTLTYGDRDSPLSVALNKGTIIGDDKGQIVSGTVNGRSALFALAAQKTVVGALLQVDASVTTATESDRGIVLSAGRSASPLVSIGSDSTNLGAAKLVVNGDLSAVRTGADVVAGATGALTLAGDIATGGDLLVTGTSVALGGSGTTRQRAGGQVAITATTGAVTGTAGLDLESNAGSATNGTRPIVITAANATNGAIRFETGSTLVAGGASGGIQLSTPGAVTLGSVSAHGDVTIGTTAAPVASVAVNGTVEADTITVHSTGAQSFADTVDADGTLTNTAGGLLTFSGAVQAAGDVTLTAGGVRLTSIASDDGQVKISAGSSGISGSGDRKITADRAITLSASGGTIALSRLTAGDALSVTATTGAIQLNALTAGGDATLTAGTTVTLPGAIAATGNLTVTGTGVTLGSASSTVTQRANGAIQINAGAQGITGLGALTLQSAAGGGTGPLTLTVTDATGVGGIVFAPKSALLGGTDRQAVVTLNSASTSSALALGTIRASELDGSSAGAAATQGLVRDGALTIGDVAVRAPLTLQASGITAGSLTSGGALTLVSTGALSATALSGGTVALTGTGTTTIGGAVKTTDAATGDVTIDRDDALSLGTLAALGDVTIGGSVAPTSLNVTGTASTIGGTLRATVSGAQNWSGSVTAGGTISLFGASLTTGAVSSANGAVALTASTGTVSTGTVSAADAATINAATTLRTGNVTGGAVRLTAGTTLDAGRVRSTAGDITVSAPVVTVDGIDSAGAATLGSSGDLSLVDGHSAGAFIIDGGGTTSVGGTFTVGSASIAGNSVVFQNGARLTSAGSIDILARTGGIASGTGLVLSSTGSGATDFVRLRAAGSAGIALGGSTILAGNGRALPVAVFNGTATAPLALGRVDALTLVGLPTFDADPLSGGGAIVAGGALSFGALTLTRSFAATATTGDLKLTSIDVTGAGQGIALTASTGALQLPATVSASGDIVLAAQAALALADVTSTSGGVSLTSQTALSAGTVSGTTIVASGPSVELDTVDGGSVALTGGAGGISLGGGHGASATLQTSSGGAIAVLHDFTLDGALQATAGGNVSFGGSVTAGATSTVTGGSLRIARLTTSRGTLAVTARSGTISGATADNGATLGGAAGLTVTAPGAVSLAAADGGSGALAVTAGQLAVARAAAGTSLTLTATGDASVTGPVTAGGAYTVSGAHVTLDGTQSAGGAVSVTARGALTGGAGLVLTSDTTRSGTGTLALAGANGVALSDSAVLNGGPARSAIVTVDGGGQAITLGTVNARALAIIGIAPTAITTGALSLVDALSLTASGNVTIGTIDVSAGDATLASGARLQTGTITARDHVSLTGARVEAGDITSGTVALSATADGIAAGVVTARGPVTIDSRGGTAGVTLAGVKTIGSGGSLLVTSTGAVRIDTADISGSATLITQGNPADIVLTNGLTATGAIQVTSSANVRAPFITSRTDTIDVLAVHGALTGLDPDDTTQLTAGPGHGYTVNVGGDVRLGVVGGGPISLVADSIFAQSIDTGTDLVNLAARAGDLTIAGAVIGGDVTLTASRDVSIGGNITASGAVVLSGGRVSRFGDVTGSSVTASATGALSGGTITAPGGVTLSGGGITLDRIVATAGNATVTSTADVRLGSASVSGDLAVNAAGLVALPGAIAAGGAYRVRGGSVALGGASQSAGGSVDITATAGAITGDSGLTLTSGGGQALVLDSAGGIALANTVVTSGGALGLRAGDGAPVVLGQITAASVGGVDAAHTDFSQPFGHAGNVTLGAVTAGRVDIALSAGDLSTGRIDAGSGAVQLSTAGTGTIRTDSIAAGTMSIGAGGTLTGASYVTSGKAGVSGASVTLDSLSSSAGDVTATGLTDVSIDSVAAGGSATLSTSTGVLAVGGLTAGGAATLTSGGALRLDQASAAALTITAAGDIGGRSGARTTLTTTAGDLAVTGGGRLSLGGVSGAGGVALTGNDIDVSGTLAAARSLLVKARAALVLSDTASAGTALTIDGGTVTTQQLTAGGTASITATGQATVAGLTTPGAATLAGAALELGTVSSGSTLDIRSTGTLAAGTIGAGGALTLVSAGALTATKVSATGAIDVTASGLAKIGRIEGGPTVSVKADSLQLDAATGGALTLTVAQDATLGTISATGALNATAATITATALQASGDLTVTASGAASLGTLSTAGVLTAKGGTLTATSASADKTMNLTSDGALSLGSGRANGATIDAGGTATLGALAGGPSLMIRAADVTLTGTQSATAVTFQNRTPATTAMRLGDGTAADGFALSAAELGRIAADTVTFDQGSGALEIGTVALTADAGRHLVQLLSTGVVTVDGTVSGGGAGRTVRIGGSSANDTDLASRIAIVATSTAGGRLLLGDADLDLRGTGIAAGLANGFVSALTGTNGATVANGFIGNANSALFNANLGGGSYAPGASTILSAHSLTVRYGDYALFQNTGQPGLNSGVVLGGTPAAPVRPALTLIPEAGNTGGSFALFGTINGIGGTAAALLGPDVVSIDGVNLARARINGCLIGSGAGCLATIAIQPRLQVFDQTRDDIFGAAVDLAVPFDPVVGGSNEQLLTALDGAPAAEPPAPPPSPSSPSSSEPTDESPAATGAPS